MYPRYRLCRQRDIYRIKFLTAIFRSAGFDRKLLSVFVHETARRINTMAAILPEDWERIYGHRVVFLETFVTRRDTRARATGGELGHPGAHDRTGQERPDAQGQPSDQGDPGLSAVVATSAGAGELTMDPHGNKPAAARTGSSCRGRTWRRSWGMPRPR